MTRILIRSAVLLGLGLTLTACAQHNPAQANCFNFLDPIAQADTARAEGNQAMGRVKECDFVMLGAGG